MILRKHLLFYSMCIFLLSYIGLSYSVEKFPPERNLKGGKEKGDLRYEGIRRFEDVWVGQLVLKSAIIQYNEKRDAIKNKFNIGFYVDNANRFQPIDILIEDKIGKSYYMIPFKKKWDSGFQNFQWDNAFARKHTIDLKDLYARAEVRKPGSTLTIIPIFMYCNIKPERAQKYSFTFVSTRQVTLKHFIYDKNGKLQHYGLFRSHPKNTDMVIKWDSKQAEEGMYRLLVEYTFLDPNVEELSDTYEFYHKKE